MVLELLVTSPRPPTPPPSPKESTAKGDANKDDSRVRNEGRSVFQVPFIEALHGAGVMAGVACISSHESLFFP